MKRIVVTGADGYIGSHVLEELARHKERFDVTAAVLDAQTCEKADGIRYVTFDFVRDYAREDLYEALMRPEICLHLAWRDGFVHNSPKHMEDISCHFGFLKNLADHGTAQFAVAGSFREYGSVNGMTDVDAFAYPDTMYTLSKTALKRALEIYFAGKDVCLQWFRPFTVYGDEEKNHSILSKIITWEKEGRKTFPFTDGNEEYDYIEIHELARQITAIVSQREISGAIDCCTGVTTRLGDMVERFLAENRFAIRPEYGAFPSRSYDSKSIYGDVRKIDAIMKLVGENG